MMHASRQVVAVLLLAVTASCSSGAIGDLNDGGLDADAGVDVDAGILADAGSDAGAQTDAGNDGDAGTDAGAPIDAGAEPSLLTVTFTASDAGLLNPERGFYDTINLIGSSTFSSTRAAGRTLALAGVRLDAFRTTPIDAPTLAAVSAGLGRVRTAGIKVILRFQYNEGPIGAADASRAQVLAHLTQLQPILQANADVIAAMQAGFIGAWGEWHSSSNGLDNTADRTAILQGILAALPASRMVQVRTPHFVDDIFPGGALSPTQAFSGTNAARTGHHNDCFLANNSDYGTYQSPVETWKDFVAAGGRFTPVGGETCAVFAPRSECASATAEMARLHFRFLNSEYHLGVLGSWTAGGCMKEVEDRLGYRFVLQQLAHSSAVRPGGLLHLRWTLRNDGYGAPFNARPLQVVLEQGALRRTATLSSIDVRRWEPGLQTVDVKLRLPANLPVGNYRLSLALPDADPVLAARPVYSVQFANTDLWDATAGVNVVVPQLVVSDSAGGQADPSAMQFVEEL
ncbi:MAG: DUF4832 domain-containing protein [Archangium sp.]|nr:DUF4832 domain-containing protein [Archangium sp.]MDP3571221.1 DUF4832 domain-containing protein [Archangium sp.]